MFYARVGCENIREKKEKEKKKTEKSITFCTRPVTHSSHWPTRTEARARQLISYGFTPQLSVRIIVIIMYFILFSEYSVKWVKGV